MCAVSEMEREGGVSQRVSPLAHVRDCGNLLTRAGMRLPAVDVDTLTMNYPSATKLVEHLRVMGETNAGLSRRKGPVGRETAAAAAACYHFMFPAAGGGAMPPPTDEDTSRDGGRGGGGRGDAGGDGGGGGGDHGLSSDGGGDGDLSLDGGADGDLSFAGNPQLSIPPPISSGGGGGIEATWQVLYMTGWSHGDGQQQAAQRGSAGVSLSQLEEELEKLPEPDKA